MQQPDKIAAGRNLSLFVMWLLAASYILAGAAPGRVFEPKPERQRVEMLFSFFRTRLWQQLRTEKAEILKTLASYTEQKTLNFMLAWHKEKNMNLLASFTQT